MPRRGSSTPTASCPSTSLFQFNPFYFIADVTAMLALRVGSSSIASIKLDAHARRADAVEAPRATRELKLCWFLTVKIRFSKTFGETRNTTLPPTSRCCRWWCAALDAARQLGSERRRERHRLVSLRDAPAPADAIVVHPVGIAGDQPEGRAARHRRSTKFGAQRPADARRSAIGDVQLTAMRGLAAARRRGVVRAGAVLRADRRRKALGRSPS